MKDFVKNLVFAVVFFISAMVVCSCNSEIKEYLRISGETGVKGLKVSEVSIEKNFYRYTEDYKRQKKLVDSLDRRVTEYCNSSRMYCDLANSALSCAESFPYNSKYWKEFMEDSKEERSKAGEYVEKAEKTEALYKKANDRLIEISNVSTGGTLYVLKYKSKDTYGRYSKDYHKYDVVCYNPTDNRLYTVDTDRVDIISSVYPEVSEEILGLVGDCLKGLFTD